MFQIGPKEMLAAASATCDKYGIDVGLWYPMKFKHYTDPKTLAAARAEWAELLSLLARLDEIQIPAGDPGSHNPAELLHATSLFSRAMRVKFPQAKLWLGPQEWSATDMQAWWALAAEANTSALLSWGGLVYGPHTAVSLSEFVKIPAATKYRLRLYPDITHSLTTQFPVPHWDRALAMTESREAINPRPQQYGHIAALHLGQSGGVGFSSYSEGCNDDINKFVWSAVAWGNDDGAASTRRLAGSNATMVSTLVRRTICEFSNVFISSLWADDLTAVIMGLETAWMGPLASNSAVPATLQTVRRLQRGTSSGKLASNWRWQQLQYRAFYDSFVQRRLAREQAAEDAALAVLCSALADDVALPDTNALPAAIAKAVELLGSAALLSSAGAEEAALGVGVEVLAGRLFESIRMQLSVPLFFAEYTVRGANLDTLRLPLTNAPYLLLALADANASQPATMAAKVRNLTDWSNPGAGGYYDDLGDPQNSPHLVVPLPWAKDPDYYVNPSEDRALAKDAHWDKLATGEPPAALVSPAVPVAWQTTVNTFYQAPLKLRYSGLEVGGNYIVDVVYTVPNIYEESSVGGRLHSTPKPLVALAANGHPVHPPMLPPPVQQRTPFAIPKAALAASGDMLLQWTMPPDMGGSGTGNFVAEVIVRKIHDL